MMQNEETTGLYNRKAGIRRAVSLDVYELTAEVNYLTWGGHCRGAISGCGQLPHTQLTSIVRPEEGLDIPPNLISGRHWHFHGSEGIAVPDRAVFVSIILIHPSPHSLKPLSQRIQ